MKSLEDIMPAMAAQGVDVESLIQQMGITTSTSSPTQTHTLVVEITGVPTVHGDLKARRDDGTNDALRSMWCTQIGGTYAGNGDCQNATTSSEIESSSSSNTALTACNAIDGMLGPGGDFAGVCETASTSSTTYTAMSKRSVELSTFKTFTSTTDILPGSVATGVISAPSSTLATVRKRAPQPTDLASFDSVPPKAPGVRRGAVGENSTGLTDTVKHEAESVAFKVGALFGRSASPVSTRIGAAVGTPGEGASGLNSTAGIGAPVFRRSNGTLPAFRRDMWGSLDQSKRKESSQLVRRSNGSGAGVRRDMLGSSTWHRRNEGNVEPRRSNISGDSAVQARDPWRGSHKKVFTTSSSGTPGSTSPAKCVDAKKSLLPWSRKKSAKCALHHGDTLSTSKLAHQCEQKNTPVWKKVLSLGRKKDQKQKHCTTGVAASATSANHAHMAGLSGSTGEGIDGHHGSGIDHAADLSRAHGGVGASDHDTSTHDAHDSTGTGDATTGSGDDGAYDPNGGSGDGSDSSSGDGSSGVHEPGMGSSGHGEQHDSTGSGSADDGAGDSTGDGTGDNPGDNPGDGTGDGTGSSDGDGDFGAGDGSGVGSGSGDSSFKTKRDIEGHLLDDAEELDADDHASVTRRDGGEDRNVEEADSGLMERDAAVDENEPLEADGDYEHAQVKRDGRPAASRPRKRPAKSIASSRISKTARKQKCKWGSNGFNRCLNPKCLPGQEPGPKCDCWYGIDFKRTCLQDGTPYKACGMGIKPQQSCLFAQVESAGIVSKMVSTNKLKSGRLQSCQLGQRLTGKCACLMALNGKCMRIPILKRLRVETFKATVLDADHAIGGAHGNMKGHAGAAGSPPSHDHQARKAASDGHDVNDASGSGHPDGNHE